MLVILSGEHWPWQSTLIAYLGATSRKRSIRRISGGNLPANSLYRSDLAWIMRNMYVQQCRLVFRVEHIVSFCEFTSPALTKSPAATRHVFLFGRRACIHLSSCPL
jgi:hypothetical protein